MSGTERFDVRSLNRLLRIWQQSTVVLMTLAIAVIGLAGLLFTYSLLSDPAGLPLRQALAYSGVVAAGVVLLLLALLVPKHPAADYVEVDEGGVRVEFSDGTSRSRSWSKPSLSIGIGLPVGLGAARYPMGVDGWKPPVFMSDEAYDAILRAAEERGLTLIWEGSAEKRIGPVFIRPPPPAVVAPPPSSTSEGHP